MPRIVPGAAGSGSASGSTVLCRPQPQSNISFQNRLKATLRSQRDRMGRVRNSDSNLLQRPDRETGHPVSRAQAVPHQRGGHQPSHDPGFLTQHFKTWTRLRWKESWAVGFLTIFWTSGLFVRQFFYAWSQGQKFNTLYHLYGPMICSTQTKNPQRQESFPASWE